MADLFESLRGTRVLVTGGLGFIGSNLSIRLVELGAAVTILDCALPGSGANLNNIEPIRGRVTIENTDIRDSRAVAALRLDYELVFNLAAQISHVDSMRDPLKDQSINAVGQLGLLEACRARCPQAKIIFTGTRQQYGRPQYVPIDEKHPLSFVDINAIHKTAAEAYHLLYHRVYGLRSCSIRLSNVFGPRMLIRTDQQTFVGWFINRAMSGKNIDVFGDGSQRRDMTYIDDAVDALLRAGVSPKADGEIFNLGGPEPVTLSEVADATVAAAGAGSVHRIPFPPERKAIDVGDVFCSWEKISTVLGWRPLVDLSSGLAQSVEFYRSNWNQYT